MQIPVLVEPTPGNGFRARSGEPLMLTAEGSTRDEALGQLRSLIQDRVAAGAQIVPLDVPSEEHPLAPFAGMLKDDPMFDEWQKAIEEYRRERDQEDGLP